MAIRTGSSSPAPPGGEVGDDGLAHARVPELDEAVGDQRRGLVLAWLTKDLPIWLAM
jgi:hypothetical protein